MGFLMPELGLLDLQRLIQLSRPCFDFANSIENYSHPNTHLAGRRWDKRLYLGGRQVECQFVIRRFVLPNDKICQVSWYRPSLKDF